jgi:hypothetical protein
MIPAEEVIEAVVITGNKNGHPGTLPAKVDVPFHGIRHRDPTFKIFPEAGDREAFAFKITFQAHKKYTRLHIHMLVQIDYISTS